MPKQRRRNASSRKKVCAVLTLFWVFDWCMQVQYHSTCLMHPMMLSQLQTSSWDKTEVLNFDFKTYTVAFNSASSNNRRHKEMISFQNTLSHLANHSHRTAQTQHIHYSRGGENSRSLLLLHISSILKSFSFGRRLLWSFINIIPNLWNSQGEKGIRNNSVGGHFSIGILFDFEIVNHFLGQPWHH